MARPSIASARRDQIVWALYECLAQSDFGQVTIKDIAHQADVAPGIIHHYFTNKDEIYAALSIAMRDRYETSLDEHLADQPNSADRAEATLGFIVDEFILDRSLNRVFYNLILQSLEKPPIRAPLQELLNRYRDRLHDEYVNTSGAAIVAQIEGLALQNLVDPKHFTREEFFAILRAFLQPSDD